MLGFSEIAGESWGEKFAPGLFEGKTSAVGSKPQNTGICAGFLRLFIILFHLILPLLFFNPHPVLAGDNGWKMQDTVTLSKGTGSAYTTVCAAGSSYDKVARAVPYSHGFWAVALSVTGSGTAQVTYEVSPDNVHWFTPVGASAILTGVTSASPKYAQFSPDFAFWIRFTVTETGGASSLTSGTLYLLSD